MLLHNVAAPHWREHSRWAAFPRDAVPWKGSGGKPATLRSSDFSNRAFCRTRGSSLRAIDNGPNSALVLGAFDTDASKALAPQHHSHKGGRPGWWCIEIAA
jgi:hypothetical protein